MRYTAKQSICLATVQKLLEEEERASRRLQQQLRQQASSAVLALSSASHQTAAPDLQARLHQCLQAKTEQYRLLEVKPFHV